MLTVRIPARSLDSGRRVYRPPADLADFVIARDRVCLFVVGCNRPARNCDIDHRVPWARGGTTDPDQLSPLCRRHHLAKDHGPWRLHRNRDGTLTWTSATGKRYTVRRPSYTDP